MIIDTLISVAFKNSKGLYQVVTVSVFELEKIEKEYDKVILKKYKNNEVIISIKCIICGEYHSYRYKISDFLSKTVNICGCEKLGIPIIIIAKPSETKNRIKKYEEVNKRINEILMWSKI